MNQLLTVGQCVVTESSSSECTIEKFLGGGGQGEVYEAKVGGRLFALKWYFQASATAQQRNALEALVERVHSKRSILMAGRSRIPERCPRIRLPHAVTTTWIQPRS